MAVSIQDIEAAAHRIAPYVHCTPLLSSALINRQAGCEIFFKCENLQKAGAFKARGAHNAVLQLSVEQRSFRFGEWQPQTAPVTVADGLRTALGKLNFSIIQREVDDILTASDEAIVTAMRLVWTRMKLVVETSAVPGLAVVMSHPERFCNKRVVVVLSGGNVDIDTLPW